MPLNLTPLHELPQLAQLVHWIEGDLAGQQWLPVYTKPTAVFNLWRKPEHEFLFANIGDEHMGFAHIEYLDTGEATFSYYISEAYRGRGLGRALIDAIRAFLRQERGIHHLLALVDTRNEASSRSLTKAGFIEESHDNSAFVTVYASRA